RDGLEAGLADFAEGARLEVNPAGERIYDVNGALERVQGRLRLVIEKHRAAARRAAAARKKKQDRVRYEQLKQREDVVLLEPDQTPPKAAADVQELDLPEIDLGDQDPFASGAAFVGGEVVQSVTPSPPEPVEQEEAEAGAEPEAEDQPAEESGEKPSDPFSDISGTLDRPQDDTAETEASGPSEKPSAASSPFEDENPFGDGIDDAPSDDPIFDENVAPKLPADMNVDGGNIMDVLEKTFSGTANQSSNRDPFSDDEPAVPAAKQPGGKSPVSEKPAPQQPAPAKSAPEKPAPAEEPIDDNPFDNPFD
ncbi:MAG: hypothetical protein ACODAD_10955, partial [Planctomycetota bacterium]